MSRKIEITNPFPQYENASIIDHDPTNKKPVRVILVLRQEETAFVSLPDGRQALFGDLNGVNAKVFYSFLIRSMVDKEWFADQIDWLKENYERLDSTMRVGAKNSEETLRSSAN